MTEKTQKIVYKMLVDIEREVNEYKAEMAEVLDNLHSDMNKITMRALKEMRGKR